MSEDKIKKTRRHWLIDTAKNVLTTIEMVFKLDLMTDGAVHFLTLYGLKQYLADCLAVPKPIVLTEAEIIERLENRFGNLCSDKFELTQTDSGYYWKDPNAVTTRSGGIKQSALYDYFIADGHTHEEATAAINKIKS